MLKKLGRNITVFNAIAFTVVLLVGGVSMVFAKNILHNAYKIEEESEHISIIHSIHTDAYRLVLAMHHFLIDADKIYAREAISLISQIKTETENYKAVEAAELYAERNLEIELLNSILEDIRQLGALTQFFEDYSKTSVLDRDELMGFETFAYDLEASALKINEIHFNKIRYWQAESLSSMSIIAVYYAVFLFIGGISIFIGHKFLKKNVVDPIKILDSATLEFAEGALDKRVHTHSHTEIGRLYQSFNKMAEKLQQNDMHLRRFNEVAAGVSHEVKNPLNVLSVAAQKILKKLSGQSGSDPEVYKWASYTKHEINRINNILEEFVKFAKFPEPQFFENDITGVIKEVADLISENAKISGVTIKLSLQENVPIFRFDARQLKEVLMNLSKNAVQAMKNGGMLEIKTAVADEKVFIHVTDTGEGISENNLDKIFTSFFSTKEGGLGLGLPIVQKIIESHGGKISCTSHSGKGTTFEIILPVKRGQALL
jgi:signal transduction histidine kinase